ncbi:MAG TPA: hypothetical protein VMA95_05870 [Streptosporangiaceae bacterium]|nr:hypothetical protein [Streptosporangiaceae bacterium]
MRDNIRPRRRGFLLLATALALAGAIAASAPGASAASLAGTRGSARPSMLLPGSARLNGVYCTASTNCWGVGILESPKNAILNQVVHWNGKKWTRGSVPSPGGNKPDDSSQLGAVRCTSATNCWAVGTFSNATTSGLQALHWNGKHWGQTPVPAPAGTGNGDFNDLNDVACTSASSCWAVGDYGNVSPGGEVSRNLALHWTGKKWFKVSTPNPSGTSNDDVNGLYTVRCTSPDNCWAGGSNGSVAGPGLQFNEMLHWNGKHWSAADVPSPTGIFPGVYNAIGSLSCTSASNCWAVGIYGGGSPSPTFLNEAIQWNGHNWTQVKTPNPDGTAPGDSSELASVNCSAANNCWAVGNLGTISSGGAETGEVLHWKGVKWSAVKAPNPGGTGSGDQNNLSSVRCVSQKDCWIVGFSRADPDPDLNLTLHWNSKTWSAS